MCAFAGWSVVLSLKVMDLHVKTTTITKACVIECMGGCKKLGSIFSRQYSTAPKDPERDTNSENYSHAFGRIFCAPPREPRLKTKLKVALVTTVYSI